MTLYDDIVWYTHTHAEESDLRDFRLWCLGHNFDVVGAILSMATLSWQKGFDAGRIIANFAPESSERSQDN